MKLFRVSRFGTFALASLAQRRGKWFIFRAVAREMNHLSLFSASEASRKLTVEKTLNNFYKKTLGECQILQELGKNTEGGIFNNF
jgi:hypothetical protein